MPEHVLLIRHGETEWSRDGRHTGRTDIALTSTGERQARALVARVRHLGISTVITSPLRRARETAQLAGLGDRATLDSDLAEWDYGALEGRTTEELVAERPGWDLWVDGPPEGESLVALGARVDRVIERVLAGPADGTTALVAHGHVLRVLTARWLGCDAAFAARLRLDTAALCELGFQRGRRTLESFNDDAHLAA